MDKFEKEFKDKAELFTLIQFIVSILALTPRHETGNTRLIIIPGNIVCCFNNVNNIILI